MSCFASPRAGGRTRRVPAWPQALRSDAGLGNGSVAARHRGPRRLADIWCALPKIVFSRTLDGVQGNARLAEGSLAEEVAAALDGTERDVSIGGAGLAGQAGELGLLDELRMFRYPIVVGGDTPLLPPAPTTSPWT